MALVGLVLGRGYGTEGIEPANNEEIAACESCKGSSGSSFCEGYRGYAECGEDLVVYCKDPRFFRLPLEVRLGMINEKDRVGEILDLE